MVLLAIALPHAGTKVRSNPLKVRFQTINAFPIKNLPAIFRHEDQMHVHCKYAVPASSNVLQFVHRSSIVLA